MTRTLLVPLTILLAVATGLTLLGIATTLPHTPIAVVSGMASTATGQTTEIVHQFYAAANEVLQTGDATSLSALVAPDYRESTLTASQVGIDGYTQFLTELRSACPDCRLEVEELAMGHDEAAVRVSTHGIRHGTVQGVSVEGLSLAWWALDVLQLVDGQVAERWSHGEALTVAEPLFTEVEVDIPADTMIVQVSRLILPVGASLPSVVTLGPLLLVVEAGALTVQVAPVSSSRQGLGSGSVDAVLRPEERLVIPPGVRPTIRNDGRTPAIMLVLVLKAGPGPVADVVALS
jgi:predicted ester cyclase